MRASTSLVLVVLVGAYACAEDPAAAGPGDTRESIVIAAVEEFQTTGFARISGEPRPSQHATDNVVIWVSDGAASAYADIDPASTDATAPPFPEGTIIVKEHFQGGAASGEVFVMAKREPGYNPAAGDWWWGSRVADGHFTTRGRVSFCIDCHRGNNLARTDWVKGVQGDNRAPGFGLR